MAEVSDLHTIKSEKDMNKGFAKKIALNLFNYLQSFN
jgi:hypothetical protein